MNDTNLFHNHGETHQTGVNINTDLLITTYLQQRRTLDDLPYTPDFQCILETTGRTDAPRETLHLLHNLRKAGKLPKLGRATTPAVKLQPDEEQALRELVTTTVGSLGRRDALPYTDNFQTVLDTFNARTGRQLEHHTLWRLIARLAK